MPVSDTVLEGSCRYTDLGGDNEMELVLPVWKKNKLRGHQRQSSRGFLLIEGIKKGFRVLRKHGGCLGGCWWSWGPGGKCQRRGSTAHTQPVTTGGRLWSHQINLSGSGSRELWASPCSQFQARQSGTEQENWHNILPGREGLGWLFPRKPVSWVLSPAQHGSRIFILVKYYERKEIKIC